MAHPLAEWCSRGRNLLQSWRRRIRRPRFSGRPKGRPLQTASVGDGLQVVPSRQNPRTSERILEGNERHDAIAELTDVESVLTALARKSLVATHESRYRLVDGVADRLRRTGDLKPSINRAITYFTAWADRHRRNREQLFEAADALAKSDQAEKIAGFGGRPAIESRGSFAYSPAPGTEAVYN